VNYLLDEALEKQRDIYSEMQSLRNEINQLIIVQVHNKNEVLIDEIERYFENRGKTYDNQKMII
jgi:type III restriction enzyme